MGRCLPVVAGRAREGGPHGEVGDFSIPRRENEDAGLVLATLPCPVAAACPMRARARAMRRGHRVSVAKGRPDRNAGGEGRLRGRDGGACSECRVNNFHLRGCSRPCARRRRKMRKRRRKRRRRRRRRTTLEAEGKKGQEEKESPSVGVRKKSGDGAGYREATATLVA